MNYISPDFSQIFIELYAKYLDFIRSKDEVLGKIKTYKKLHRGGTRYTHENKEHFSSLDKISSEASIKYDYALEYDISSISETFFEMSQSYLIQMQKMTFQKVTDISELTGNVFNAQGKELTFDMLNDQLKSIEILFDKKGEAILPTLYCNYELYEKIKNLKPTQDQLDKQAKIIETKREEYFARKLDRNLSYID